MSSLFRISPQCVNVLHGCDNLEVPNLRQSLGGLLQPENWSVPQFSVEIREASLGYTTKKPLSF